MNDVDLGLCQCGCGEQTRFVKGKYRKFVFGHHARGACNPRFGVKLDSNLKQKISQARKAQGNPWWLGREHTEESKKKMSESQMGIVTTPRAGEEISCTFCDAKFYLCQSQIEYKSQFQRTYCSKKCQNSDYKNRFNGSDNPFYGKHHSEETKEKLRKATLAQRAKGIVLPSLPEKMVHKNLNELQIKFETEKLINDKFCVDIYLPKYNLIIFVDGCYWHACPIHCPNAKKPKSDNARIPYLSKCGYKVEILWEHDIKQNCSEMIQRILKKYEI